MYYITALLLVATMTCSAQTEIPNGDFESWTLHEGSMGFNDYEEPTDGWASGNPVAHIQPGAEPVCEKSDDATWGSYSAKLVTRKYFNQIASGSLYLGEFKLNLGNPGESARLGKPCSSVPATFRGMYKYFPEGGDSAIIRATFRRWNGSEREIVAEAILLVKDEVAEWTSFSLPIPEPTGNVDTVEVAFASSAGGEFLRGDEGSTLYIDDVAFDQTSSVAFESSEHGSSLLAWQFESTSIRVHESLVDMPYQVVDLQGRIHKHGKASDTIFVDGLTHGVYMIAVGSESMTFTK